MIKIDASNLIPKRAGTYLLGIIPGFFFEMTLAFGDPSLAHRFADRARQIYPFQGYALFILFAISCLLIGQTFYFLAWFLDWLVDRMHRVLRHFTLHLTLGSDWLYRAVGRWQGIPPKPAARHLWRVVMWARKKKIPFEVRPILVCQRRAALQLLRRKYGITIPKLPSPSADEEWQAWLSVLGKAPAGLRESFLLMRISLACGLGELATLYICPGLRNRYFVTMCGTLLLAGILQLISFVRRRNEPVRRSLITLGLIMEELSELAPSALKNGPESDASSALTLRGKDDETSSDSDLNAG